MVSSAATAIGAYLASLPDDRHEAVAALRTIILSHLPPGYEACMQSSMPARVVPLSRYPKTHNKVVTSLASQKNHGPVIALCEQSRGS